MPRTSKDITRKKIRDAFVAEVAENGIAAVNIAGVVKRARISAGSIYVHFENKEDMLRQIYLQLKAEFHNCVTQHRNVADTEKRMWHMWMDMFQFVRERPLDFMFLDYANAAKFLLPEEEAVVEGYAADIASLLRRGVEDGTLAEIDSKVLSLLLVAPAMQLARQSVLTGIPIPEKMVERTFERVWLSIANNERK